MCLHSFSSLFMRRKQQDNEWKRDKMKSKVDNRGSLADCDEKKEITD